LTESGSWNDMDGMRLPVCKVQAPVPQEKHSAGKPSKEL